MELIDFEGIFQAKILETYHKNRGKFDAKKVHKLVRKTYSALADTPLPGIKTAPRAYFREKTDAELCALLLAYDGSAYEIPELLTDELSKRDAKNLLSLLDGAPSEKLLGSALVAIGANPVAYPRYFELMGTADDALAEQLFDLLSEHPEESKAGALALSRKGIRRELMLDLLSRTAAGDDEVLALLLHALHGSEDLSLGAKYLARYGDSRALGDLVELMGSEDIDYAEYQELRCAAEALGGTNFAERDFTDDPAYQAVLSVSQPPSD